MPDKQSLEADSMAVRAALWRALHVQVDPPPHVLQDEIGLRLAAPEDGWRHRPDMNPHFTNRARASVVARARFIEDMVVERASQGVGQYVVLGAGLDTFAQRRPEMGTRLRVFEIDRPGPSAWKRARLVELGFGVPDWLRLVSSDFEVVGSWWERLRVAGFDARQPAVVACAGVVMYLSRAAITATLRQIAALAPGSKLAMTFMLPMELVDADERSLCEATKKGARAAGTSPPSFFAPADMLSLAREAGLAGARHISGAQLGERYFAGRTDDLRTSSMEDLLVASI